MVIWKSSGTVCDKHVCCSSRPNIWTIMLGCMELMF